MESSAFCLPLYKIFSRNANDPNPSEADTGFVMLTVIGKRIRGLFLFFKGESKGFLVPRAGRRIDFHVYQLLGKVGGCLML